MTTDIDLLLLQRSGTVRKAVCTFVSVCRGESDVWCLLCGVYEGGGIKTCLGLLVQPLKDSSLPQRGNFTRMCTRRWAAGGLLFAGCRK